jgi:DNA polymerase-1
MEQAQSSSSLARLLIVDGHAYAYRAFHAIRSLSAPDGSPTNAIFGFIKMCDRLRASLTPSHLAVVWDGGLCAVRMTEHPAYKAQRPPMPDALESQIAQIEEYLQAAGVASLCAEGIEADDWIATLAQAAAPRMSVVIASSDKDFMQLVNPRIGLINPNDKSEKIWSAADVVAKAGVRPEQIVDWLALIGDAVDNIPGVTGVGPKTAADLLRQFGNIAGIQANLAQVKSERLRHALGTAWDVLERNRRLIGLKPIEKPVSIDSLVPASPRQEVLLQLFTRWGFRGMKAALEAGTTASIPATDPVQQALF